MGTDPKTLEEQAYKFLYEENFESAFRLFRKAAELYREQGNDQQAALCFASAGSCWSIKSGEKTFSHSASSYEDAARAAERVGDLEYASMLYRQAAINYERDMESINFSECFYRSKECYRRFLTYQLLRPGRIHAIAKTEQVRGIRGLLHRVFSWLVLTISYLFWGHGEKPARTFCVGIGVVLLCACAYQGGSLLHNGARIKPDFFQALYFSAVTFTTVGYGDMTPLGACKALAGMEALSGMFVPALFVVGLSRKFLRT